MFPRAVLAYTLPSGENKIIPLSIEIPVTIGRSRTSTIKLNLPSVSRKHAQIYFDRDVFWIEDLGSSNGTFVNQKQVQKARISLGDILKCGDFSFTVKVDTESRPSLPPGRTSTPPSTPSGHPIQELPTDHIHFSQMGSRRDATELNAINTQSSSRQPWHSRAPTHGPDRSTSKNPEEAGHVSRSPAAQLLKDRADSARAVGLSRAYTDDKLLEARRNVNSEPVRPSSENSHPMRQKPAVGQGPIEEITPDARTQNYTGRAEDLQTEVMRLKINEQQLLEEVAHLNRVNESLISQLDETRERTVLLEGELDQQHQNAQELRRHLEQLELDHLHRERMSDQEKNRLLQDNEELNSELYQLKDLVQLKDRELREHAEQGERERATLHKSLEDVQVQLSQNRDNFDQSEIQDLRRQNRELVAQLEHLDSMNASKRDHTAVSFISLPQPNRSCTDPDWARHLARYDQLMNELMVLRQKCRKLKSEQRADQISSDADRPISPAPEINASLHSEETPTPKQTYLQAEEAEERRTQMSADHDQLSEEPVQDQLSDDGPSSFQQGEAEVNEEVSTSVNSRRAWKGLL